VVRIETRHAVQDQAYRRLAAAVLLKAANDAQAGAEEARQWLAGEGASLAEMALEIDPRKVRRWAEALQMDGTGTR